MPVRILLSSPLFSPHFCCGVYIILAGVRMVIAEIVPAFKGIADKLVKDAKPALDCPTVFPFAPNAVIVGFLASFVAGPVSMFLCPLFGLSVIVPGWFLISSAGQRLAFTAISLADVAGQWWGHLPTACSFRSCRPSFCQ